MFFGMITGSTLPDLSLQVCLIRCTVHNSVLLTVCSWHILILSLLVGSKAFCNAKKTSCLIVTILLMNQVQLKRKSRGGKKIKKMFYLEKNKKNGKKKQKEEWN